VTTMKAVCIRSFGGPEVLELADIEKPEPADEEVLIRVRAASVNPVDYKIRSGSYPVVKQDQLPKVLGCGVAGQIAHCGRAGSSTTMPRARRSWNWGELCHWRQAAGHPFGGMPRTVGEAQATVQEGEKSARPGNFRAY
jgi:Alcohol dehydrogenase GroES-like domain